MIKYREYFKRMLGANKELFDKFTRIHFDYSLDEEKNQEEFNQIGNEILKAIHLWEGKLCQQSEKAGYSSYTGSLAEKFQAEIKNHFPLIDHIGILTKNTAQNKKDFFLPKIRLFNKGA